MLREKDTGEKKVSYPIREESLGTSKADAFFEASAEYAGKVPGAYNVKDYEALPDDIRVELIDGVFYDMGAPSAIHQMIIGELFVRFTEYIRRRKGDCRVFLSPFDVRLDQDDHTIVEPDLSVFCSRNKVRHNGAFGAPDLVVEVLSPSTRHKDIEIKSIKYENAGVREYWMIDSDNRRVIVYPFEGDGYPRFYSFESKVPVGIWDGNFEIDFAEIAEALSWLPES